MDDSNKTEASHITLALDLTKKSKWDCSNTFNCTRVLTKPCRTVALSKSSHLCRDSSLSFTGSPRTTSQGPQRVNSSMDLTWLSETDFSLLSKPWMRVVSLSSGSRSLRAVTAHSHREQIFSSVGVWQLFSSLSLQIENRLI